MSQRKEQVVSIYRGTQLIGWLPEWRGAESYIKTLAHCDGVTGGSGWERSRGRNSFECGIFRALDTYRDDVLRPLSPSRPSYYVKATDGEHLRMQLAQTPERGNELMLADIKCFDPFQK